MGFPTHPLQKRISSPSVVNITATASTLTSTAAVQKLYLLPQTFNEWTGIVEWARHSRKPHSHSTPEPNWRRRSDANLTQVISVGLIPMAKVGDPFPNQTVRGPGRTTSSYTELFHSKYPQSSDTISFLFAQHWKMYITYQFFGIRANPVATFSYQLLPSFFRPRSPTRHVPRYILVQFFSYTWSTLLRTILSINKS